MCVRGLVWRERRTGDLGTGRRQLHMLPLGSELRNRSTRGRSTAPPRSLASQAAGVTSGGTLCVRAAALCLSTHGAFLVAHGLLLLHALNLEPQLPLL